MKNYGKFIEYKYTYDEINKQKNNTWFIKLKRQINIYSKQKILKYAFTLNEGRNYGNTLPSISVIHYNNQREKELNWNLKGLSFNHYNHDLYDEYNKYYDISYKSFVQDPRRSYLSWINNQNIKKSNKNVHTGVGNNILNYLPEYKKIDYLIVITQITKKLGLGQYRVPRLIWLFFNIKNTVSLHDIKMIKYVKERLHNTKFIPYQLRKFSYIWKELQYQWNININVYIHLQNHIALNNDNTWKKGLSWSRWGYGEEIGINDMNLYNQGRKKTTENVSIPSLYWFHYDQIINTRNIVHTLNKKNN